MILAGVIAIFFLLCLGGGIVLLVRASGRASSDGRHPFFSIVPRPAKVIATTLLCIAVTVGVIAGSLAAVRDPNTWTSPVVGAILGLLGGTFVGCLFLIWILALGYVYGDARRRNMPPALWTLVAFLVPNLLGFLLYFVLRKPLGRPCPHCGQAITAEQRFCSWCGWQQYAPPYPTTVAPSGPTGLDPRATG